MKNLYYEGTRKEDDFLTLICNISDAYSKKFNEELDKANKGESSLITIREYDEDTDLFYFTNSSSNPLYPDNYVMEHLSEFPDATKEGWNDFKFSASNDLVLKLENYIEEQKNNKRRDAVKNYNKQENNENYLKLPINFKRTIDQDDQELFDLMVEYSPEYKKIVEHAIKNGDDFKEHYEKVIDGRFQVWDSPSDYYPTTYLADHCDEFPEEFLELHRYGPELKEERNKILKVKEEEQKEQQERQDLYKQYTNLGGTKPYNHFFGVNYWDGDGYRSNDWEVKSAEYAYKDKLIREIEALKNKKNNSSDMANWEPLKAFQTVVNAIEKFYKERSDIAEAGDDSPATLSINGVDIEVESYQDLKNDGLDKFLEELKSQTGQECEQWEWAVNQAYDNFNISKPENKENEENPLDKSK